MAIMFSLLSDYAFSQAYNESDKEMLRKFLRQPSAIAGQRNLNRVWRTPPVDTSNWYSNETWVPQIQGVTWNSASPKRITKIEWNGAISTITQLSGFLDAAGCDQLTYLLCESQRITAVSVSTNIALKELYCGINRISSLDVRNNVNLTHLDFCQNQIDTINVRNNTKLVWLCARENRLRALDITGLNNILLLQFDGNCMKFSTMPVNNSDYVGFSMKAGYTYGNQKYDGGTVYSCSGLDLSAEMSIKDFANIPRTTLWSLYYESGLRVAAQDYTFKNGVLTFNPSLPDGKYQVRMENSAFGSDIQIYEIDLVKDIFTKQPTDGAICRGELFQAVVGTVTNFDSYQFQQLTNGMWKTLNDQKEPKFMLDSTGTYRVAVGSGSCRIYSDTFKVIQKGGTISSEKEVKFDFKYGDKIGVSANNAMIYTWLLNGVNVRVLQSINNMPIPTDSCIVQDTGVYKVIINDVCAQADTARIIVEMEPVRFYVDNNLLQKDKYYALACGTSSATVSVKRNISYYPGIYILQTPSNTVNCVIGKYGKNYVKVTTVDIKGRIEENNVVLDKYLPSEIFTSRWNNVLVVPLSLKIENFDIPCTTVQWYKVTSTGYSKVEREPLKGYIKVEESGYYFVVVNNEYRSCEIYFDASQPLAVYPNPVKANTSFVLNIDSDDNTFTNVKLLNMKGDIIKAIDVKGNSAAISAPEVPGIYTVITEEKGRYNSYKIVVIQ